MISRSIKSFPNRIRYRLSHIFASELGQLGGQFVGFFVLDIETH